MKGLFRIGIITLMIIILGCAVRSYLDRPPYRNANLIIVVLDAMRADHVGCYGYPRPTTPNIDRLARESVTFHSHYCQMPFTTPSTASLFTGQYPDTHWVIYPAWAHTEPEVTMASVLQANGFRTALFSSTPCASPAMGVGTRFEKSYYRTRHPAEGPGFSPESLLLQFEDWLDEYAAERFFAYLHFLPPHNPYDQPAAMTKMFEGRPPGYVPTSYTPWDFEFPIYEDCRRPDLEEPPPLPDWINLYDANLRYGDWAVRQVVQMLEQRDLWGETIVIITSDHGEAFGEHGYIWHPQAIHQEAAKVPLVIRLPDGRVGQCDMPTQTIDIFPTICDFFRIAMPDGLEGCSLAPSILGGESSPNRYAITESFDPRKYMVRTEDFALLLYAKPEWRALYDLQADGMENDNVIEDAPENATILYQLFEEYARTHSRCPNDFLTQECPMDSQPKFNGLPTEVQDKLRALGYLR